ncbi:MAG TPA: hypothetical protein VIW67_03895 [Terriglobales bacterium]
MRELQYCNLWAGTYADWGTGGSDTTVDVQLPTEFFIPSADVGSLKTGEGEASVERQRAAVGVPGQRQVDAQLGGTIKAVGCGSEGC